MVIKLLMHIGLYDVQYCAKVMQTNFNEFFLLLGLFDEISFQTKVR